MTNKTNEANEIKTDNNTQSLNRRNKLNTLRQQGCAYPNDFRINTTISDLKDKYGSLLNEEDKKNLPTSSFSIAGRIMTRRTMGKASFAHIQDMTGHLQLYLKKNDLPEGLYETWLSWDTGDIIGVEGTLFYTKTKELTIHCQSVRLLTKALHPLPEKYHGLTDQETRYRKRYLDLMTNPDVRNIFHKRSTAINTLRNVLTSKGFLEVETPMMQTLAGGALARPFETYHNALNMPLYLRIAPELYLKRLVVGGFDRVFEINRNFRNEGISTRHNPEFTMLEFYQAYADYQDMMSLTETLLRSAYKAIAAPDSQPTAHLYQGHSINLAAPFKRHTVKEAILHQHPDLSLADLEDMTQLKAVLNRLNIPFSDSDGLGKLQIELFEKTVEKTLIQPTFITAYPIEVSPLSRPNDQDPTVADRFELFIGGQEVANGFSELNDPDDQAERFREQLKQHKAGDKEAMRSDTDYITALEYGLPPTGGCGMGIDRLMAILFNVPSIREVILFPLLRNKDVPHTETE